MSNDMNAGVMPGLVRGIHVFNAANKTWMARTRPAMAAKP
jgi:hypothetical protein